MNPHGERRIKSLFLSLLLLHTRVRASTYAAAKKEREREDVDIKRVPGVSERGEQRSISAARRCGKGERREEGERKAREEGRARKTETRDADGEERGERERKGERESRRERSRTTPSSSSGCDSERRRYLDQSNHAAGSAFYHYFTCFPFTSPSLDDIPRAISRDKKAAQKRTPCFLPVAAGSSGALPVPTLIQPPPLGGTPLPSQARTRSRSRDERELARRDAAEQFRRTASRLTLCPWNPAELQGSCWIIMPSDPTFDRFREAIGYVKCMRNAGPDEAREKVFIYPR